MRILFVVLSPLRAELGAAQMASNLADALRAQGIDAVVWSPQPVPREIPWWRSLAWIRNCIAEFVERNGPFDCVDVPPVAVSRRLARAGRVIARTVQPDLAYLWAELRYGTRVRTVGPVDWMATAVYDLYVAALVVLGWMRARRVLCLGRWEFDRMRNWLPWWRAKLATYVNAVANDERVALVDLRSKRAPRADRGARFLWIGRWGAQKGADRLLEFIRSDIDPSSGDRVTIAGCGEGIERWIPTELLGTGAVRIVPSYDRRGLIGLLAEHDAGLFTSRVEGWGLTLQEMLESGMPVYATKVGAAVDLKQEFPQLIRPFPPPAPPRAMAPETTSLSAAYIARYSWAAIAKAYLDIVRHSGAPDREGR
jgi:glycosyltransferase involved in cell wall biosynthesis